MWVTEIHHNTSGLLIGRMEHGPSYMRAMDMHNSYMFRFAGHRVHLIWEE